MHVSAGLHPIANPASATSQLPDPKQWPKNTFGVLIGVTATVLISPFLIWALYNYVSNWGSWRLHKGAKSRRKHYIKTWHGWVEQEKYTRRKEMRRETKNFISRKLIWRTATADYSWVFWDPDGTRQKEFEQKRNGTFIRLLPEWMRSYENGALQPTSGMNPNILGDVEHGLIQTRPFHLSSEIRPMESSTLSQPDSTQPEHSGPVDGSSCGNHTTSTSIIMSGALVDVSNERSIKTIRQRSAGKGKVPIWLAKSEETTRATRNQLLMPKLVHNPSSLLIPDDVAPCQMPSKSQAKSTKYIALGAARNQSLPLVSSIFGTPTTRKQAHQLTQRASTQPPKLYASRNTEDPKAPENSEDSNMPMKPSNVYYSRTMSRASVGSYINASIPRDDDTLVNSLDRRLKLWSCPMHLDPYTSVGSRNSGTTGRVGSPAMAWAVLSSSAERQYSMQDYEAEGSLDDAMSSYTSSSYSPRCYQASIGRRYPYRYSRLPLPWVERYKSNSRSRQLGLQAVGGEINSDLYNTASPALSSSYATHVSFSIPVKRKRLVDRAICASPIALSVPPEIEASESADFIRSPVDIPISSTYFSKSFPILPESQASSSLGLGRSSSLPNLIEGSSALSNACSPPLELTRYRDVGRPFNTPVFSSRSVGPRKTLTTHEKTFLNDLHSRLDWLHYELSPGFRGPKNNQGDMWYLGQTSLDAVGPTADCVSRVTQSEIRRRLSDSPDRCPRSMSGRLALAKPPSTGTPDITAWRTAVNDIRRLSGGEEMLRPVLQFGPNGFQEAEEGAIDTSAWMLRKPPQGFPHVDVEEKNAMYTGVRGKAMTQAQWEEVGKKENKNDKNIKKQSGMKRAFSDGVRPYERPRKLLRRVAKFDRFKKRMKGARDDQWRTPDGLIMKSSSSHSFSSLSLAEEYGTVDGL
ncbi:hypothetical protein MMC24_000838 [Lignoscripta atroalba]|nr:hypothetical protein [Lignoscripta atroalba]